MDFLAGVFTCTGIPVCCLDECVMGIARIFTTRFNAYARAVRRLYTHTMTICRGWCENGRVMK